MGTAMDMDTGMDTRKIMLKFMDQNHLIKQKNQQKAIQKVAIDFHYLHISYVDWSYKIR